MKICIYTDNHFCESSSIIKTRGEKYSARLENQIKSLNWVENLASKNDCAATICLGDFFDKNSLNAEELTALRDIEWNNTHHIFLVGNHEASLKNLKLASTHILHLKDHCDIIDEPLSMLYDNKVEICFLPYISEENRKPIDEYFNPIPNTKRIVLSHNDLKGIQYGKIISSSGFCIDDILHNCDLYINGHLHNHSIIESKIINLGNLTGLNFSEDAFKYKHKAMIIDLDTFEIEYFDNPYAFNFYKLDFTQKRDIDYINDISSRIARNAIVMIKCLPDVDNEAILCRFIPDHVNDTFPKNCNIIAGRVHYQPKVTEDTHTAVNELIEYDYMKQFSDIVIQYLGDSNIIKDELVKLNDSYI